MLLNKLELVDVNWYGDIYANDEAAIFFTLLALHLSRIFSKKMWNKVVINYHMVTFFAIQYINLLGGINYVSILIHVKENSMTVLMSTVAIKNIEIEVWTPKYQLPVVNYLCYLMKPEIIRQRPFKLTYIDYDKIKD